MRQQLRRHVSLLHAGAMIASFAGAVYLLQAHGQAAPVAQLAATAVPLEPKSPGDAKPPAPAVEFVQNVGQFDSSVHFVSRTADGFSAITDDGLVFTVQADGTQAVRQVKLEFAHGQKPSKVEAIGRTPGVTHYYLGTDRAKWRENVPSFASVRVHDVYPGVDVVYRGDGDGHVEYDFELAAGVSPEVIALNVRGADSSTMSPNGAIALSVGTEKLELSAPRTYQTTSAGRVFIDSSYRVSAVAGAPVTFAVAAYDRARTLVIDPLLRKVAPVATSNAPRQAQYRLMKVDALGNTYTGFAAQNVPFTVQFTYGTPTTTTTAQADIFVEKRDSNGVRIFSAALGGLYEYDAVFDVQNDTSGNTYLAVAAGSSFPTTRAKTPIAAPALPPGMANIYATAPFFGGFVVRLGVSGTLSLAEQVSAFNTAPATLAIDALGDMYLAEMPAYERFFANGQPVVTNPGPTRGAVTLRKLRANGDEVYEFNGPTTQWPAGQPMSRPTTLSIPTLAVDSQRRLIAAFAAAAVGYPLAGSGVASGGQSTWTEPGDAYMLVLPVDSAVPQFAGYFGGANGRDFFHYQTQFYSQAERDAIVRVDASDNIYLAGLTQSRPVDFAPGGFGLLNAVDTNIGGQGMWGATDAGQFGEIDDILLVKLSPGASTRLLTTYAAADGCNFTNLPGTGMMGRTLDDFQITGGNKLAFFTSCVTQTPTTDIGVEQCAGPSYRERFQLHDNTGNVQVLWSRIDTYGTGTVALRRFDEPRLTVSTGTQVYQHDIRTASNSSLCRPCTNIGQPSGFVSTCGTGLTCQTSGANAGQCLPGDAGMLDAGAPDAGAVGGCTLNPAWANGLTNVVQNPSFSLPAPPAVPQALGIGSAGLASWSVQGTVERDASPTDYMLRVSRSVPNSFSAGVYQDIDAIPGHVYRASFCFKGDSSSMFTNSQEIVSCNGQLTHGVEFVTSASTDWSWGTTAQGVKVPSGCGNPKLRIWLWTGGAQPGTYSAWYDKVVAADLCGNGVCDDGFDLNWNTREVCPADCGTPPTGGRIGTVSSNSATVAWDSSGASSYAVSYRAPPSTAWLVAGTTTGLSLTITGLQPAQTYEWLVRGNLGAESAIFTFTTPCPTCVAPTGLANSGISSSGANLSWTASSTPSATSTVFFRASGATSWQVATGGTATTRVLTGLAPNTTYEWYVQASCACGSTTASSAISTFSTLATCAAGPSQALVPVMTGSGTPSGVVTASSSLGAGYEAWRAFDANNSTLWISNTYVPSAWVAYDWNDGVRRVVTSYRLQYANGSSLESRAPKNFRLEGWNGATWVTVDTRTNQTGWYANPIRDFTVQTPGTYTKYRLFVTADNANNATYPIVALSISAVQLFGSTANCCTANTCSQVGATCGDVSNGCGGTVNCGQCEYCGDGICSAGEQGWCSDCGPQCGDGDCDPSEYGWCSDCGPICGGQIACE